MAPIKCMSSLFPHFFEGKPFFHIIYIMCSSAILILNLEISRLLGSLIFRKKANKSSVAIIWGKVILHYSIILMGMLTSEFQIKGSI